MRSAVSPAPASRARPGLAWPVCLLSVTFLLTFPLLAVPSRGASPALPVTRASVLLVTVDTLRADRLAPGGPMPRLAEIAQRGARFERAYSHVPLTLPSHVSMLSGRIPLRHGVRDNLGNGMAVSVPSLVASLRAAGYRTAAFVGGQPLVRGSGIERGFELYDDTMTRAAAGTFVGNTERRAEEVARAAATWLASVGDDSPIFLWAHLYDPHDPYEAPPPFAGNRPTPYDDEVAYADDSLGRIVAAFESRLSPGAPRWIIVAGDHGEALGAHGEATHGVFLYDATLRVPLVVVGPSVPPGCRVEAPVALSDVPVSILDALALPPLPDADGRSFVGAFRLPGAKHNRGPIYLESIHGRRRYGWSPLYGVLEWPMKFVEAPRPEVYALDRDPGETVNVHGQKSSARWRSALAQLRADATSAVNEQNLTHATSADLERLASLGYIGGSAGPVSSASIDDRARPDPKDRIGCLGDLEAGLTALTSERDGDAKRLLEAARGLDPQNLVVLNNLGILALRSGDLRLAEGLFREGLRNDRSADNLANNLGLALTRLGRHDDASRSYRQALDANPGFVAARFNLALALHRVGRHGEALVELRRVERSEPGFRGLAAAIAAVQASISRGERPSRRH